VIASKDGYLPVKQVVDDDLVEITLPKLVDMNVVIMKHPYDLVTQTFGTPRPLDDGDKLNVFLTTLDEAHQEVITFPNEDNVLTLVQETTNYTIDTQLTLFDELIGGYRNENIQIDALDLYGQSTMVINVIEVVPHNIDNSDYRRNTAALLFDDEYSESLRPEFR
jgi:hypothetical protein